MSAGATQDRIWQGHAARKAGRAAEALDYYRSAVEVEPESAEANTVYGLMLLQLGRAGEAEGPLRKAADIAPAHPAVRMNLAQWHAHEGNLDEAVRVVAGIVDDEPNRHWAWERLGELKARLGRFGEAADHFGKAVELQPQDPSLIFKLAQANFDSGRRDESRRLLAAAAALAPGNPAILRLDADLYEAASDWAGLERAAVAWRTAAPRDPAPWRALAKAQWESGYPRLAMQSFQKSFELGSRTAEALATYGRVCLHALDVDAAEAALGEAERLDPKNSAMLTGQAILQMWKGRLDKARDYCRRSLAVNPDDVTAYKTLATLHEQRLPAEDLAALGSIVERDATRTPDRITALFTLADSLDVEDRTDEAFATWERANQLAREQAEVEGLRYDAGTRSRQTEELIALFRTMPKPQRTSTNGPTLIFIVGMPRSGTTLVESVLGAHSKVVAGGELGGIRWILPNFLAHAGESGIAGIPAAAWAEWRAMYRQMLPEIHEARAVTDKNPWNYDAIGLILHLFPNARIVHVRRNPVETGFSIFRNEFSKLVRFTNRLEDIGHYYGEYARVMAHWDHVAGGAFRTIQYEDFVKHFEPSARALIAYCGLEWEQACANFWESERVVSTISTMQVRRPPQKPSVRSRSYAAQLGPLVESLRAMRVDLETGKFLGET